MALEAILSANEPFNSVIYDTISATPLYSCYNDGSSEPSFLPQPPELFDGASDSNCSLVMMQHCCFPVEGQQVVEGQQKLAVGQGRKKKRPIRRPRDCKNKEAAEAQRMTHIAVERNRRKLMNEHLAVLRSVMPESYVQRGDQASIVGGAIQYVKELEHFLQSLEAQKILLLQGGRGRQSDITATATATELFSLSAPFAQFFGFLIPQCTRSDEHELMIMPAAGKCTAKSKASAGEIEVTLIETHANVRILSRKSLRQLSKMVAGFQTLNLTILHLSVTTLDPLLVLYSISSKVEEGCQLASAEDIASAVNHMLTIIEEEGIYTLQGSVDLKSSS